MTIITVTMMSGPNDGHVHVFHPEPTAAPHTITIGRRDTCDIPLAYDTQVSRLHAHIIYDGIHFWLEDLDSRNGTFIGEDAVKEKTKLDNNTLFKVGRTWMQLTIPRADETQSAKPIPEDDTLF